jgi:hypothetical protein
MTYAKTSYINQGETLEPLQPSTSTDPRAHENSSPNLGAVVSEISSIISLTSQNKKKTPWSESASELHRPSDHRLSAN